VEERKGKIDVAQELIFQLDQAQELEEVGVRKRAKQRILAFSALRRIKIRQRSRLTWIRTGDANTKLFHLRATGRRRKNYIPALVHHGRMVTAQKDKSQALYQHFSELLGSAQQREATLN
jgi:hypothetical protein